MGKLILSYIIYHILNGILRFITFTKFSDDFYQITSLIIILLGWSVIGLCYLLQGTKTADRFWYHIENFSEKRKRNKKLRKRMSKIDDITKELEIIKKEYELEKDDTLLEPLELESKLIYLNNNDKYNHVLEQEEKANALFERYKDFFNVTDRGISAKSVFHSPTFSHFDYEPEDIEYLKTIYPIDPKDIDKIINRRKQCVYAIADLQQKISLQSVTTKKGKHGEDAVMKFLSYYKDNYIILENILVAYEDSSSESDAIIICDKGIFVIEVKNHGNENSRIEISKDGRWSMVKNGKKEVKENVSEQNNRHCAINQTILNRELKNRGIDIEYIKCNSIVVIANDKVELINESSNAVLRKSEIITYIENLETNVNIPKHIQEEVADIFKSKNLPPNKFPVEDLYNNYCIALREFEKTEKALTGYTLLDKTYRKYLED